MKIRLYNMSIAFPVLIVNRFKNLILLSNSEKLAISCFLMTNFHTTRPHFFKEEERAWTLCNEDVHTEVAANIQTSNANLPTEKFVQYRNEFNLSPTVCQHIC